MSGPRPTLAGWLLLLLAAPAWAQASAAPDAGEVLPPVLVQASPAAWPGDAGAGGEVELLLTIDEVGAVTEVQVTSSSSEALTAAALEAAPHLRFEPATQDGQPVRVLLAYRYRFEAPTLAVPDGGLPPGMARLTGRVLTRGTREPVLLAQVAADGPDGGFRVETDERGGFAVTVAPGTYQVLVSGSGHVPQLFREWVSPGQRLEVVYRLERSTPRPYETIVKGQQDRAEVSRVTLSGAELHEVAGTNGEPLRVVMLLPGVVTPASGLSYPVVRGSLPAATGFFLDGVRVPQLFHLLVGSSVVHPEFIESLDFYAGNAPTRYGRLTGGVVSATVAKAHTDRERVVFQPDLLQSQLYYEQPVPSSGTSVTLAGRINYTQWLLGLLSAGGAFGAGVRPVFESYDYQVRVEQKVGPATLRLLAFGSSDVVGTDTGETVRQAIRVLSRFHRVDLKGQVPVGPGVLEVGAWLGWETMGLDNKQGDQPSGTFLLQRFAWTARATYRVELGDAWQLKGGVDLERQSSDVETSVGLGPTTGGGDLLRQPRALGTFVGAFAEAAFTIPRWTVVAGVRVDTWHLAPDFTLPSVDPRVEARYELLDTLTLKASAGLAHQAPLLLISLPVNDVAALRDGLQEVGELTVGARWVSPWWGLELSGEVFYNHYFQARERSLQEFVTGLSTLDDRFAGNRSGRAYGLELLLRLPQQGSVFGWLSYTLSRSERMRRYAIYNADQSQVTDTTAMVPFAFDQTHSLNLVAGYQFPMGFKVGVTFHVNSGRPESGEFSSRTARVVTDPTTGSRQWSVVSLGEVDRLPPFARLDLRASKTFTFDQVSLELYLDVFNISFSQEVYGFDYTYDQNGNPAKSALAFPVVLPTLGLKVVY